MFLNSMLFSLQGKYVYENKERDEKRLLKITKSKSFIIERINGLHVLHISIDCKQTCIYNGAYMSNVSNNKPLLHSQPFIKAY